MKILADTNILISAFIYPASKPSLALLHTVRYHELVLSDYNIAEFRRIADRKFSKQQSDIDVFLAELSYETVIAPLQLSKLIDDPNDAPILNAAILADIDIIISGDRHFLRLDLKRPLIMSPARFLEVIGALD